MIINDQMARPHSENNPSTSKDVNEGNSHPFRRPYIEQESQYTLLSQIYPSTVNNERQYPYGIQEMQNDQRREHGQSNTGNYLLFNSIMHAFQFLHNYFYDSKS